MDIKRRRREAGMERRQIDDNYPGTPPGSLAQGSAASDQNPFWWARAQSWSEGVDTDYEAVCRENEEQHQRWGTPWRDEVNAPNVPGPDTAKVGVASYNADDPLPDPNNFHSNPGYMGTSTASSLAQSAPGGIYRTPGPRTPIGSGGHRPMPVGGPGRVHIPGKTVTPASRATQPESEGAPLVVQTGFPGR